MKKMLVLVSIAIVIVFIIIAKRETVKNLKAVQLDNPPLKVEYKYENNYLNQLTEKEMGIYEQLINKIDKLDDGVVEFNEPITGIEFLRIKTCVEVFSQETSIAYIYRPMTQEGYTPRSLIPGEMAFENEEVYSKCILFIYGSDIRLENVKISDEDYIINLSDFYVSHVNKKLAMKQLKEEREGQKILDEVINNIPEGSGQLDSVYYFIEWITNNITYDNQSIDMLNSQQYDIFGSSSDLFNYYIFPSSLSSVSKGEALCLGYAKALDYLCKGAGIESRVVIGSLKNKNSFIGHALTEITIDGKKAYFDLSVAWDYLEGTSKALSIENIEKRIELIDYLE